MTALKHGFYVTFTAHPLTPTLNLNYLFLLEELDINRLEIIYFHNFIHHPEIMFKE